MMKKTPITVGYDDELDDVNNDIASDDEMIGVVDKMMKPTPMKPKSKEQKLKVPKQKKPTKKEPKPKKQRSKDALDYIAFDEEVMSDVSENEMKTPTKRNGDSVYEVVEIKKEDKTEKKRIKKEEYDEEEMMITIGAGAVDSSSEHDSSSDMYSDFPQEDSEQSILNRNRTKTVKTVRTIGDIGDI